MQHNKPLFAPIPPPLDPVKRAKAIRDAIAKKRIKQTKEVEEVLALLDQIVAIEEKTA